jgi:hypothetical protein
MSEHAHEEERSGLVALSGAWNREFGLRYGDRVDCDTSLATQSSQWQFGSILRLAWKQVGKHHVALGRGELGIGETRRPLDALISTARCLQIKSQECLASFLGGLREKSFLVVHRFYDATPLFLTFGSLQSDLQATARYLIPDPTPDIGGQ